MFTNEITNQSSIVQRQSLNACRGHRFVKILCLTALVLMVSEMAMASDTTLAAQLDKIAASCSLEGDKRSVLGAIGYIGLILVMCRWWRKYCHLPTADDKKQTSKPEVTIDATSQQSNKPTTIN